MNTFVKVVNGTKQAKFTRHAVTPEFLIREQLALLVPKNKAQISNMVREKNICSDWNLYQKIVSCLLLAATQQGNKLTIELKSQGTLDEEMETKPGQTKQSGKNFFSTLIFEEDYRYSPPDPNVVVAELLALNACGSVITARTGKHRVFKLVLPASGGSTFIG